MNDYLAGQVAKITCPFLDDTGTPVDPTTVTLKWQAAGGTVNTITYTGATVPAVGVLARTAPGVYVAWIDTTGLNGILTYEPVSTGLGQTVGQGELNILPAPL